MQPIKFDFQLNTTPRISSSTASNGIHSISPDMQHSVLSQQAHPVITTRTITMANSFPALPSFEDAYSNSSDSSNMFSSSSQPPSQSSPPKTAFPIPNNRFPVNPKPRHHNHHDHHSPTINEQKLEYEMKEKEHKHHLLLLSNEIDSLKKEMENTKEQHQQALFAKEVEQGKIKHQLQTLRGHLIEQEDKRTVEILENDKAVQTLKDEIKSLKEETSVSQGDLSEEARRLQEQLHTLQLSYTEVIQERDDMDQRLVVVERELQKEKNTVKKLQSVLSTFEEEKAATVKASCLQTTQALEHAQQQVEELKEEVGCLQNKLDKYQHDINSVATLKGDMHEQEGLLVSSQTENKRLKYQMSILQGQLESTRTQLESERMDRMLLKNSMKQFFSSKDKARQREVLGIIADICDFSEVQRLNAGLPSNALSKNSTSSSSTRSGFLGGLFSSRANQGTISNNNKNSNNDEQSNNHNLSEEFVSFLLKDVQKH
eukprot:m.55720 g.55720  ORF g.55720 m.55720 type:complete len:486 (-) comp7766_c3_seq1:1114-2571(-)